uniref:Carbohydrate sulfotransferase n=1 Tax=Gopherus agassizii TaxID=38772 RepID=A0A452H385_9SAUR
LLLLLFNKKAARISHVYSIVCIYVSFQLELSNTAILHQIRRDQVTDTCRANSMSSRKRRVLTPNDLKHLVVDENHEMIYCYVPKVACTNWKRVMMVLTGRGKYSDPMEIPANEAHISSNLKTLNQYSIPEINHRLKSYMKFLFVREPFERLVSAYRNKFTQKYNTSFHKRYGTKIFDLIFVCFRPTGPFGARGENANSMPAQSLQFWGEEGKVTTAEK